MPETAIPTTAEEAAARALAEQAGLEYRSPGAVAVDPRALAALAAADCRRLGAVPLSASGTSVVVAIADPSAERRDAVKAAAALEPRFVVIPQRTLDALLRSRMLGPPRSEQPQAPAPARSAETPPERTPEPERPPEPEPLPPAAAVPAPPATGGRPREPVALDMQLVDAIVAALEPRLQALAHRAPDPEPEPEPAPAPSGPAKVSATIAELVAQADASISAWSNVRSSLVALGEELDSSRHTLRDAKERLSVAHADNDQHQRRIHELEAELEERQAVVEETRARLQDAADALGNYARRLESTGGVI